jgi:hypothetical protein
MYVCIRNQEQRYWLDEQEDDATAMIHAIKQK